MMNAEDVFIHKKTSCISFSKAEGTPLIKAVCKRSTKRQTNESLTMIMTCSNKSIIVIQCVYLEHLKT